MPPLDLIATSTMGLEAVVSRELKQLGYEPQNIQLGRTLFQTDPAGICRANLWLRAAGRVLLRLGTFPATDFGQLFDQTYALPWEAWLPPNAAFPVKGRSIKSQLSSVPACQRIVKKAIVEKLLAAHAVSTLDETGPQFPVEIALLKDQATLTIDTSGSGLHKRGYRKLTGRAPLRETLSAALVMLSYWRSDRPLIDPFCGSGTIPIEAALIGRNMAPGLKREFIAESWPTLERQLWESARTEALDLAKPTLPVRIIGTDIDPEALSTARYHADQAGVAENIHFQQRDFSNLLSKQQYGCLITNPPYAERMGEDADVREIYESMPNVLRRLKTWSHYILTAYPNFEELVGQKANRRRKLYNATIECTYYQFHGPKPGQVEQAKIVAQEQEEAVSIDDAVESVPLEPKPVAAPQPAFGGLSSKAREQAELFRSRITKRAKHLRRWPTRQGITCFRLYDRDIPEIPLVVDRYEDCLHVTEYERPHDRTPAEHADWLDLMVRTAGQVLDVSRQNSFLKRRQRQRGSQQHERTADDLATFVVNEGGLRFEVNLSDYVDTGLFLDHRITRSMVREAADGKRFLNLFGYTGAFSVYAAAGGAQETVTVDLSNTYLAWTKRNLELNGLTGDQHLQVRSDALEFLKAHARHPCFDLAVVDPPTFSNSKTTEDVWDVQRDHVELLDLLIPLITPGGLIFFSTNFRRFKLAESAIQGVTIREVSRQTVPDDFRNQRIHRCWRMVKEEAT